MRSFLVLCLVISAAGPTALRAQAGIVIEGRPVVTKLFEGCFEGEGRHFECLNGAVKDAVTGLVWLRVADCAELPGTGGSNVGDWFTAHAAAAALEDGICGLSDGSQPGDWRLPTQREWEATLGHARDNLGCIGVSGPTWTNSAGDACWTSLEPEYEGIAAISYWSATSDPMVPSFAEVANLSSGTTTTQILKFSSAAIWPVRGKCISRDCD